MRFVISVARDFEGNGWEVTVSKGGEQPIEGARTMPARTAGDVRIPAGSEMSQQEFQTLVAQLESICDERTASEGTPESVGIHLFSMLLGKAAWEAINAAAEGEGVIELALSWPVDESDLHRLPWEMLHDGDQFLSTTRRPLVAITRLVPVETELPQQLDILPKLLFAIGSSLNDPVIRPGAEVMGILRSKREGKEFISFILESASPQRIQNEVRNRNPDVVHFICHGGPDFLRLQNDGGGVGSYGPSQLAEILLQPDRAPPLVVLSACDGARPAGPNTASLAAQMVEAGLPLVIAMGGRISDLGCRLFARRFMDSLVAGEPVVQAVGEGRSAALHANPSSAASQIEWAFPVVFQSESVLPGFAPIAAGAPVEIAKRVANYSFNNNSPPVFCGRVDYLSAFDELLDQEKTKDVLMISAPNPTSSLGEKRLLDEMAARAVKLGHVVVRLRGESPKTPVQLAAQTLMASLRTRSWMNLRSRADSLVYAYLQSNEDFENQLAAEDQDQLASGLARFTQDVATDVNSTELMLKLRGDLKQLFDDAVESGRYLHSSPVVVVLMGDVQQYDKAADALFDFLETEGRLGSIDAPVKLVVAYDESPGVTEKLIGVENRLSGKDSVKKMDLLPFSEDEQSLAISWVLVHPRPEPKYADWAYVAREPGPWQDVLRNEVAGLPGNLNNPTFYAFVYAWSNRMEGAPNVWFDAADDEDVLKKYLEQEGG